MAESESGETTVTAVVNGPTETDATAGQFMCPLCQRCVRRSPYLRRVFTDDPWGEYAASLVTHYRHEHIRYYERS